MYAHLWAIAGLRAPSAQWDRKERTFVKRENRPYRLLRGAALALLLVALAVAMTACGGGKKIDASALINVEFQGLNGEGKAVLTFDKAKLVETLSQEKALTERQMEALDALGTDLQKDFAVSKREALSNGDAVEITGGLDKDLLKDLGYRINNDTLKLTVEGLIDPIEMNAADYVILDARGFDGAGQVDAWFDTDAFDAAIAARWAELFPEAAPEGYQRLESYYDCAYSVHVETEQEDGYANGDTVKAVLTVGQPDIPECGVTLTGGEYSAVVSGLEAPQAVDVASAVKISFEGIVPDVKVRFDVDYDQPFVRYTSLDQLESARRVHLYNGDSYTLEITCDAERMRANGFIAEDATVTATVSGLPSYDFALSGLDDPMLADVAASARAEAEAHVVNNLGSIRNEILGDVGGWLRLDAMATGLEAAVTALRDDEGGADNMLFLIYHTVAPLRRVDATMTTGGKYVVVERRGVTLLPEGKLADGDSDDVRRFATMEEADAFINEAITRRLGDGATVTRTEADEEVTAQAEAAPVATAEADMSAQATARCEIGEMIPDYIRRVETWESIADPYGNTRDNVTALYAGDRARVDYLLDGRWSRFTGTLCTDSDAGTEAMMTLYVWGDGRVLYAVDAYQRSMAPQDFAIDVTGVQRLSIQTVCYGRNDHAWLIIDDGVLEATGEPVKDCRLAPLGDALVADAREVDMEPHSGMYTDLGGNAMRDCYTFNSVNGSLLRVKLGGAFNRFEADVMVHEMPSRAADSARLEVLADGVPVQTVEGISVFSGVQTIDVDVTGVDVLEFRAASEGEDAYYMDFAMANTLLTGELAPETGAEDQEAEPVEYAPLDEATLAMFEGDYAGEEIRSIASGDCRYVIVNKPCDYATAEFAAKRLGGTLAMPKTNRGNAVLTALLRDGGSDRYWIGARRQTPQSDTWVWADGEIMTDMSHWNDGEPNNTDGNEGCAMTYSNGRWNDYPGESEIPFVIQLPAVAGGVPQGNAALGDLPLLESGSMEMVEAAYDGGYDPLAVQLKAYDGGWASFDLNGAYAGLDAVLHVHPDSHCNACAALAIFGDGRLLYLTDDLRRGDATRGVRVDVTGVRTLKLMSAGIGDNERIWIDVTDAWLTPAQAPTQTKAVEAANLEAIDAKDVDVRRELGFSAMGEPMPGWIALDAADEAYLMYNLGGGYTGAAGMACAGYDTAAGETAQLRIYVDGQLAQTLEISRDGASQPFEVDLTGAGTLRFETGRDGDYWENAVYIAGLTLK